MAQLSHNEDGSPEPDYEDTKEGPMFAWWGKTVSRLRWVILILTIAFMAFAGIWGIGVFDRFSGDTSLDNPDSESQLISQRVADTFGRQNTDLIALYSSDTLTVSDPQFKAAVEDVTARIRTNPSVQLVTSYYETDGPTLVSADQHATYLAIRLVADTDDDDASTVRENLSATGLTTQVGGQRAIDLDINDQVSSDIPRAEGIAGPILVVLLLFIFGNLVAAAMPVLIGGLAVLGTFAVVRAITYFTDVSIFSINIITILGLGLAVDYGLFMVGRFREELDRGQPVPEAISRTMATAGRAIAVSGVLVSLALSSLLIFPQVLLRSMGLGGAAAALVAMVSSLTVLPALLAILGHRIDALRLPLPWSRRRRVPSVTGAVSAAVAPSPLPGRWARIAASVMRRPVVYMVGVAAVLLLLAAPFARVEFGGVDERMLPPGTQSRVVSERLSAEFENGGIRPIRVLISNAPPAVAADFERSVNAVPGVTNSSVAVQNGESTLLTVNFTGEANAPASREIVRQIRALDPPAGAEVMVGGTSAAVVDQLDGLGARLPWMALLVAGITFVFLSVAFGSVVVPLKAIVMNLVSLGAAFGVVTWIFQDGHLASLFNFTPTGYVEASQPILMVAILFGLSMDYEVFLLSRIREQWDHLGDNRAAVAAGVQRTGGIITAAAILLAVVVGAFATSGITFIKMIGVGMVVALVVDATLVRLLLVPATMRLMGRFNWWAPGFLRRLHGRYGVREDGPPEPAAEKPAPDSNNFAVTG
jgi:RND superfamily putative drug exporter